jgi:hypothetical protein
MVTSLEIDKWSKCTWPSILRHHLFENHIDLWLTGCANLKIEVTAKEAQPAIEAYQKEPLKMPLKAV